MDYQDIVRRLRQVRNLTKFAHDSHVSRATLYRLLCGWKNPNLKTLEMIEAQLKRESK